MFKLSEISKFKILNEKESVYNLETLGFKINPWNLFTQIVEENRIFRSYSNFKIYIKDNVLSFVYEDFSKFNFEKYCMLQELKGKKYSGSFFEIVGELKTSGILKKVNYVQLDNRTSQVDFHFKNKLKEFYEEVNIFNYLNNADGNYFSILLLLNEIKEKYLLNNDNRLLGLISEFLLNLGQHNYRKHSKWIDITKEVV